MTEPVAEVVDDADAWLIVKRDLFYRPNGNGYTGIRDHAGRYSHAEAMAHHSPECGETIIKLTEAPEFSKACYADLARDHLRKQRDEARAEIERLSRERDTVIAQCANVVSGWTTAANSKHLEGWGSHTNAVASMLVTRDFEMAEAIRALQVEPRERDTGVPEGFWLAPNEPPRDMCWAAADIVITDDLRTYNDPFQKQEVVSGKLAALVFQAMRTAAPQPPTVSGWQDESFQSRVQPWMLACFGAEIAADRLERSDRFIEEALELVQASGYAKDRAHQLVEYVFGRDQGEINQEVGGVMVTLAAHCLAHGVDMHAAAEKELVRVWTKVDVIRAKQASKPKGSALPIPVNSPDLSALTRERDQAREALAERQWLLSQAPEHRRPGDESIPPVRADASQAACEIIADILRIGSDVGPNGEIIISDAARFRMAHRLAHIAETGVLVDEAPSAEVPA